MSLRQQDEERQRQTGGFEREREGEKMFSWGFNGERVELPTEYCCRDSTATPDKRGWIDIGPPPPSPFKIIVRGLSTVIKSFTKHLTFRFSSGHARFYLILFPRNCFCAEVIFLSCSRCQVEEGNEGSVPAAFIKPFFCVLGTPICVM